MNGPEIGIDGPYPYPLIQASMSRTVSYFINAYQKERRKRKKVYKYFCDVCSGFLIVERGKEKLMHILLLQWVYHVS